ncbi:hypothetical protein E2L00_20195 [Cedecea colo]|uniref:Uncharacterized protein n=1 Tax=Cedecea colo TaxID=2552946 RepID=A0ABX0VRQ9_9ENTR|nr:hypothetical protein [Cedecea colo]
MLIKKEKAWFSLLCGYQPKINTLIFLLILLKTYFKALYAMRFVISKKAPQAEPFYMPALITLFSLQPQL